MADADDEAPYVRLRVSKEQKRRWRKYAEEHHHRSISGLIRESVENTISDEWVLRSENSANLNKDDLGVEELESQIETLDAKIDQLITHGIDAQDDELSHDQLVELALKCEDRLPVVAHEDHLRTIYSIENVWVNQRDIGTVSVIADRLDIDEYEAWQALEYLESTGSARVNSAVIDGDRHWFVKDLKDFFDQRKQGLGVPSGGIQSILRPDLMTHDLSC